MLCACGTYEWALGASRPALLPCDRVALLLAEVPGWHCEVRPSKKTFSLVFFCQYKTGLFFWLGFNPEKVNPILSEPLGGYNACVVHDMSRERGMPCLAGLWPALSPEQFCPFEPCLVLARLQLNLSLLDTGLGNLLVFGTIQPSQSRQTSFYSPSPKAVATCCFLLFFTPPTPTNSSPWHLQ